MIDLKDLRERPEAYKKACIDKKIDFDIDAFLALDGEYRAMIAEVESLRAEQKKVSKELPKLQGEEKQATLARMKEFAPKLKQLEHTLKEKEEVWRKDQLFIPSVPFSKVPIGKDDSENVEISSWGEKPSFSFKALNHVELSERLQLFDIERGVKIAGSRNYFLVGRGARLQHAILSYARDFISDRGYTLFDPPHIVDYRAMMGTSYFPGGEESAYHFDERDPNFYLIGTSEVPVASFHADEILDAEELPKRYAGYSPCYRREAGTYGKDTQGLYRVHQFYKVEQVVICEANAETSQAMHSELLKNAEDFMQSLELPYRVVDTCTGDMGQGQLYKNDIEAWMPSREKYSETHSCSTFHDFQARRLAIRYRNKDGKNTYCHTLNNTLIASPRVFIPFLEVHQTESGDVRIPEALVPYLGGKEMLSMVP